ncbi:MAG: glutathione S-transferase N-terminal domain-containing protein [Bdellovibrionales bacterium]|nr:glutathione S-transferase N-terminal domain-containing protein [Bdellovibrionales bacterium]
MPAITVYTRVAYCPFCERAKALLSHKGVEFKEISVDGPAEMKALVERTGMRTVPQIFFDEKLIGGFTELAELDSKGELDRILGR